MMLRKLFSGLLLVAVALVAPKGAEAMTLNVVDGEVDLATYCGDMLCLGGELLDFDESILDTASGAITIDGGNVSFNITVSVFSFDGGPDGSVVAVDLQNVNYVSGPVAIAGTPGDFVATGSATVTGDVIVNAGLGVGSDIEPLAAPFVLDCEELAGQLTCGLNLAGLGFPISVEGNTRYVGHIVDLVAVPEPQVSVMAITAGLMGLAYARRKVSN